jgi:macrodomain Ter protein organizer (MatP/YcbG family)
MMRVLCVDIDSDLWKRMKVNAAMKGFTIKEYIAYSLETALTSKNFDPVYTNDKELMRKSIHISENLWERLSIAAAENNVSKKSFLSAALEKSLETGLSPHEKKRLQEVFGRFHQQVEDQLQELVPYKERLLDGEDPGRIMADMVAKFKIPALNDPEFNRQHPEIISFYRIVAGKKELRKRAQEREH